MNNQEHHKILQDIVVKLHEEVMLCDKEELKEKEGLIWARDYINNIAKHIPMSEDFTNIYYILDNLKQEYKDRMAEYNSSLLNKDMPIGCIPLSTSVDLLDKAILSQTEILNSPSPDVCKGYVYLYTKITTISDGPYKKYYKCNSGFCEGNVHKKYMSACTHLKPFNNQGQFELCITCINRIQKSMEE